MVRGSAERVQLSLVQAWIFFIYGSFAIKIESRDIVNHMIRNVILIANCPYICTFILNNNKFVMITICTN